MRVDCLKTKILQLNKFTVDGQESGFKVPHLPKPGPLGVMQKPRMTGINLHRKLKGNATAQAYTFAIRTSRNTYPKLQKSMLLANATKKTDND